ncbi:hypothetical protein GQX74_005925 [Glossina fuscipes]|nr:hypothetical protein GQX74_005925 [Glossina fuscipes]
MSNCSNDNENKKNCEIVENFYYDEATMLNFLAGFVAVTCVRLVVSLNSCVYVQFMMNGHSFLNNIPKGYEAQIINEVFSSLQLILYDCSSDISMLILEIYDENYTFAAVNVAAYGSQKTEVVLRNLARFRNVFFLLGDAAFPLHKNLLRAYRDC